jgi:hypothetical protein
VIVLVVAVCRYVDINNTDGKHTEDDWDMDNEEEEIDEIKCADHCSRNWVLDHMQCEIMKSYKGS